MLSACEAQREVATALQLSRVPSIVALSPPLDASGPQRELCLTLTEPRRYGVQIAATFIGAAGDSVGPVVNTKSLESRDRYVLCIAPDVLPTNVVRIKLQAGDSLAVSRVTWFSGAHRMLL
jgi:hypothetical protein